MRDMRIYRSGLRLTLVGVALLHCCSLQSVFVGTWRSSNGFSRSAATARRAEDQQSGGEAPLIKVAKGEDTKTVPIWLFRQAGRHLPEYMAYKEKRNKNFLQLLEDPEDVAEVTMQPLRRYNLDAGILFSDILVVPQALGIRVEMPGGKGILVPEPLQGPQEISRLPPLDEVKDPSFVRTKLKHVMDAVKAILRQMQTENRVVPLIGFSAAPWTLLFYMVGGSSRKNTDIGERWLTEHPEESQQLFTMLTDIVIEYMSAQVESGVTALQLFEAMADFITPEHFDSFAMPAMTRIADELRKRHPGIPLMVFARGANYANGALQRAGFDVVTVDLSLTLEQAEQALVEEADSAGTPPAGHLSVLQGNFDPALLRPDDSTSADAVRDAVRQLLSYRPSARAGLIFNLGAGLNGKEDPKLVSALVDAVHEVSQELGGK